MLVNSTFVSHTNDKVKRRAGGVRRAHPDTAPRSGAGDGHVASGCASYHAYSRMSCPATWPSPTPDLSYRSLHLGAVSKCTLTKVTRVDTEVTQGVTNVTRGVTRMTDNSTVRTKLARRHRAYPLNKLANEQAPK